MKKLSKCLCICLSLVLATTLLADAPKSQPIPTRLLTWCVLVVPVPAAMCSFVSSPSISAKSSR